MNAQTKTNRDARKVVVVITDGVGIAAAGRGNAVQLANTPTFDRHWGEDHFAPTYLKPTFLSVLLRAHGEHVGLPKGVMGNSEVGHSTIFCGLPYKELLPALNDGFEDRSIFESKAWCGLLERCSGGDRTAHFLGLLSDGKVHSNIEHLMTMLEECAASGVKNVKIWCLTDGRDVAPKSAREYLERVDEFCRKTNSSGAYDYRIAMVAGRAKTLMDRGQDDWGRVEKAWSALFHEQGTLSSDFSSALNELYGELEGQSFTDEGLGLRLLKDADGNPPQVSEGDALVLFNYRTDRIAEFCSWMLGQPLTKIAKGQKVVRLAKPDDVYFVTMGDFDPKTLPLEHYLLPGVSPKNTLIDILGEAGFRAYCVSEPSKFPHVTLFPNGRSDEKPAHCVWDLVESNQKPPLNRLPMMQTTGVTLKVTDAMREGEQELIIANFPSPDMIGHETNLEAAIFAVASADYGMAEICRVAKETGHIVVYGGDHGNAEKMFALDGEEVVMKDGKPVWHTAHTSNPVRWTIYDPTGLSDIVFDEAIEEPALGNLSSTIADLLGIEPHTSWLPSLVKKSG